MSIINDNAYSSRSSIPPANNLASNLLSRKRKRDEAPAPAKKAAPRRSIPSTSDATSIINSFTLRAIDHGEPQTFRVLCSLARPKLPLTFIDNADNPPRLFHLPNLHLDHPLHIVRLQDSPEVCFYAVERVGDTRYALCRLAPWVRVHDIESLDRLPSLATPEFPVRQHSEATLTSWWQTLAVEPPPVPAFAPHKAPRLSCCHVDARPVDPLTEQVPDAATALNEESHDSADDVFARLISQYLDTLYLSKTPLAFFAKGPVSRARVAFTGGHVQDSSLPDLVHFLRALILSSSTADKKYRDKLPELLKDLPAQDQSPAAKKKRRRKKLKPDKSGLLPDEADFFAKWWYQDEGSTPSDDTAQQSLRKRSTELRTRETFMQVVLILEILSLEALPEDKEDDGQQTKSKGKVDQLTQSLELLLDKLCIWNSLQTADLLGETPKPEKATKDKDDANLLPNFCVEVVIPFYMSRVPDHAAFVNKKLGGPTTSTSSRPKTIRKHPDADAKHETDKKSRRTLQRVGTETIPQPPKTPRSFSRSATDSQVVPVKRETPDISLVDIPLRRGSQLALVPGRKSEVLEKHRLRQREVDFGAIAAANDAKAKKKQEVEQKLKDAISTLKKPSRAAVSSEFADALEQRKRMAEARARPSLHKRNSSAAQVAATPKHGHKTTAIAATPHHIPAPSFVKPPFPSSGPSLVPSSNIKQKSLPFAHFPPVDEDSDDDAIPATDHRPRHRNALAETPLKSRISFATLPGASPDEEEHHDPDNLDRDPSPLRESPTLLKTPSKPQRPRFSVTPVKSNALFKQGTPKAKQSVAATPVKQHASDTTQAGQHKRSNVEEHQNIYDMLGWNDDFDDD